MNVTPGTIDLQQRRTQRAKARAAKHEARGETLTITCGDRVIAVLQPEFPIDVLEPLMDVNLDIALVIEQALELVAADNVAQQTASMDLIAKILGANPHLFRELTDAVKEMGRRLFGADGYAGLVEMRLTPWDVADLLRDMLAWYGVGLGESSSDSTPSTGGGTSNPISSPTTESTPAVSGSVPAPADTSGSGASVI